MKVSKYLIWALIAALLFMAGYFGAISYRSWFGTNNPGSKPTVPTYQ